METLEVDVSSYYNSVYIGVAWTRTSNRLLLENYLSTNKPNFGVSPNYQKFSYADLTSKTSGGAVYINRIILE
jgi:hypothetical protein